MEVFNLETDNAKNLFEHIRNRLPTGFGYGDDGSVKDKNNKYNHKTFQQSLREECEGDVGIFEIYIAEQPKYSGYSCYVAEVQIAVVCKQGDIDGAKDYLVQALNNLKNNEMSEHVWVKTCKLINLRPVGKNGANKQMVVLNIKIKYLTN